MIAYSHDSHYGTFCIQLPNKKDLEALFHMHATLMLLPIGISKLHPKDRFIKSIGRSVAESKLQNIAVRFKGVDVRDTRHVYQFTVESNRRSYSFGLSTIAENDSVKLIYASKVAGVINSV